MAHPVILPRQGQSVESCIITQWHKKPGDAVREGEVLFTYETDKATFEETAKAEGTLLAVFFQEDDDVPVLTAVAVIGNPGEDVSGFAPQGGGAPAAEQAPAVPAAPAKTGKVEPVQPAAPAAPAAGVSPRARMAAARLGVDPAAANPTGPYGRVIERDIHNAAERIPMAAPAQPAVPAQPAAPEKPAAPATEGFRDVKLSNIRRVIANTMQQSLSTMAQLTHNSSFDATRLLALRARFKEAPAELGLNGITINDLILFAVSRVLRRHPDLNAHFLGDRMRLFDRVHLGIATDTPRGLMVPSLYDADTKSLLGLSRAAKEIIAAAQSGGINPDLLTGGTFTVSNLGTLGIESFTPIINPPQVAILGVDCVTERVRTVNGQITVYPAMGLSLTYDHRAVDGAPASRFLKDLCVALEHIDALLAD